MNRFQHGIREVWKVRKNDCMCTVQAVSRPSQDDRDNNCPYCICDEDGADITTVSENCQNEAECGVCTMMNKLDQKTLTGLGMDRNKKLTAMLQLAPSVAQSLNSGEVPEDRRQVLYQTFCKLLGCKRTKLQYVANVWLSHDALSQSETPAFAKGLGRCLVPFIQDCHCSRLPW